MAEDFVLVRILNMRGVNLNIFDFDYDLTWAALFLSPDGTIYGRYGSRDADSAGAQLSLPGLRYAMQQALAAHRQAAAEHRPANDLPLRTVEGYAAAKRFKDNTCIHCHQVFELRREELQAAGTWRPEDVWVYPLPENIGLTMDIEQGNRIRTVQADSPAARAGLHTGDLLRSLNGYSVASLADVQYALHRAPAQGRIRAVWQRHDQEASAELTLTAGWRITDVSWRPSLRSMGPAPCVQGEDLTAEEKKQLGRTANSLAFRQGNFVTEAARQAGIRQNDIILGVDSKALEMSARQFRAYLRLTYQIGDRVTFNLLRSGQRLDVTLKLPSPAPY